MFKFFFVPICLLITAAQADVDSTIARDSIQSAPVNFRKPNVLSYPAAYGWAVGGTLVPLGLGSVLLGSPSTFVNYQGGALMFIGLFVGPSTGQFYAKSYNRGLVCTALRTGGVAMVIFGNVLTFNMQMCDAPPGESDCSPYSENADWGIGLMLLGVITTGTGVIYSGLDTYRAVKRFNAKQKFQYGWTPIISPDTHGDLKAGSLAWAKF